MESEYDIIDDQEIKTMNVTKPAKHEPKKITSDKIISFRGHTVYINKFYQNSK
jgi:hypothetical protein